MYKMAEVQDQDFHEVIDTVWDDLLDELELYPLLKELEKGKVFRRSELRDLQEKYHTTTEKINALLQSVKDGDCAKYEQFKRCLVASGQEHLVATIEVLEKEEHKYAVRKKPRTEEEKLIQVLREDLIQYYRSKESTISVAPLVEQHEAQLTKVYVRPPLMVYTKPNAFGQIKQTEDNSKDKTSEEKIEIRSYRQLLFHGNEPYRGIYVTADAGMGKTSFSKMLAVAWSEAHRPAKSVIEFSDKDSINTLRTFDFVFLVKLREYQCSDKCVLDDMIFEMIKSKLNYKSRYTEDFLENVLCHKRCLIIADGLDEWIHPQSCRRGEVIPHKRQWPKCSVLTTTRPWKLSTARLSKADIDRQVEISQLDETTARELECRAIGFLNENHKQSDQITAVNHKRTVPDFEESVAIETLGDIIHIPFVLLQLICLWFGNCPIGRSLCEVYSNIIELTLKLWLVKTDLQHAICECKPLDSIEIKCMKNNMHCKNYMNLLLKIGELAFSTLCSSLQEESLLFRIWQVFKYLNREELKQSLDMGLLSQVKDSSSLSEVRLKLYFTHKTLQEFFSALFIATNWSNSDPGTNSIKNVISNKCRSVSDILEMSKVFVFVCGLNPEVYSIISRYLATIVEQDHDVIYHRNRVELQDYYQTLKEYREKQRHTLRSLEDYQRFQVSCFLEEARNEHPEYKIALDDIIFDVRMKTDEQNGLVKILSDNVRNIKSFYWEGNLTADIAQILEQSECSCLEILCINDCRDVPRFLQSVLTTAAGTLKCLMLSGINLADEHFIAISTLKKLRRIDLHEVDIRRDNDASRQGYVLDLSKLSKLQEVDLDFPLAELHIDPKNLVKCRVGSKGIFSADAVQSLLAELHGSPVLERLALRDIKNAPIEMDIGALPSLIEFALENCDLGDGIVTLSPDMTNLKTIQFDNTIVSIPCLRELFFSISKLPQPVTLKLEKINMPVGE